MIKGDFRIYIVDDDESVRKALKRLIGSEGFSVDTFPSAKSFLDSVPSDANGCLILDILMPGMDGFELQQILRKRNSPLHTIFITAHADITKRDFAFALGAAGFLIKPFDDQSLLDLIHEEMEKDNGKKNTGINQ